MRYALAVLAVALVVTLAALGTIKNERDALRHELTTLKAQSALIAQQHEQKTKRANDDYAKNMASIASNYDAVIKRLREQSSTSGAPAVAAKCAGERDKDAARVRAELLRAYAAVARYADELRVVGGNCERIAE